MAYKDDNDKAIQFGEAHLRQIGGRVKILQYDYDRLDGTRFPLGAVAARHAGLSADERRRAIMDERKDEIKAKSEEYRKLSLIVEDLKNCVAMQEEWDEDFFYAVSSTNRQEISRLIGTKITLRDQ